MTPPKIKQLRVYRAPTLYDEYKIGKDLPDYGIIVDMYKSDHFEFIIVFRDGGEMILSSKHYLYYRN